MAKKKAKAKAKAKGKAKQKTKKAAKRASKPAKAKAKKPSKAKKAKKGRTRSAGKPSIVRAVPAAATLGDDDATPVPPKPLKPLTMKQRLSLIRIDPATGKCPHGLLPETCSFCMSI